MTSTALETQLRKANRRATAAGAAAGFLYAVAVRAIADAHLTQELFPVMTLGFIMIVPFVLGYLAVRPHPSPSVGYRILTPWIPVLATCLVAQIGGLEGGICIIMALPILLFWSSMGGLFSSSRKPVGNTGVKMGALLVLPLAVSGIEGRIPSPHQIRTVSTAIEIAASPATVWNEIVSVREIEPHELPPALYLRMGFPRPLSAIIDRPGLGAIRQARFAGGVLFLETVNEWVPESRLGFRIAAQTDRIPPSTLDPHVTIGGPYFDVLQGRYRIEPLGAKRVRLHLESELRVSTHFNWYAGLWADGIMRSIQETILAVERDRAEAGR